MFPHAPCGDFNWMKEIRADLDVDYIGVDIVKELVDHRQRRYGDERTRFAHLDITRDPLPTADLMMARDFFIHLSFADANCAIENFLRSGMEYLLTGTAPVGDMVVNNDMRTGKARRRCLYPCPSISRRTSWQNSGIALAAKCACGVVNKSRRRSVKQPTPKTV